MSLSQEPALSYLRQHFVCGVHDISNEPYAGLSGVHEVTGQAIVTTNGAGPHNLQLFVMTPDGRVLTCLPGYWNPQDLVCELSLAQRLAEVWQDPKLSEGQKDELFREMHLAHIEMHSPQMVRRSHMQGFDQKYEADHRLYTSDTIKDPNLILTSYEETGRVPGSAFKTTDEIMHERMSVRPFVPFNEFDVAQYVDYGKPKYDKHEDLRAADGELIYKPSRFDPEIGNPDAVNNEPQMCRQRRYNQDSAFVTAGEMAARRALRQRARNMMNQTW